MPLDARAPPQWRWRGIRCGGANRGRRGTLRAGGANVGSRGADVAQRSVGEGRGDGGADVMGAGTCIGHAHGDAAVGVSGGSYVIGDRWGGPPAGRFWCKEC